jgi:hypothetical protein
VNTAGSADGAQDRGLAGTVFPGEKGYGGVQGQVRYFLHEGKVEGIKVGTRVAAGVKANFLKVWYERHQSPPLSEVLFFLPAFCVLRSTFRALRSLPKFRSFFSVQGWDFITCLPNRSHHRAVKVMHDREPSISSIGAEA